MLLDSHFTRQLGGFRVWPGQQRDRQDVLFLARIQVLVQKEGGSLHNNSQLCELTMMIYGCHGEGMKPYILVDLNSNILGRDVERMVVLVIVVHLVSPLGRE